MKFRQTLNKSKIIRFCSSLKINVICLLLLYVLTFWGTVAQVNEGLYQSQHRFFESFVFLAFGFLPFPGGQLVMWILFINLICVALTRFLFQWRNIGILVIHFGLLLFFISGYVTLQGAKESFVQLKEGQATNLSTSYHDWEIAIWDDIPQSDPLKIDRDVISIDFNQLKAGLVVPVAPLNFNLSIKEHYRNSIHVDEESNRDILNASGIRELRRADLNKSPEKNMPGVVFGLQSGNETSKDVLLFSEDNKPLSVTIGGKTYKFLLRLNHSSLPFTLKLIDFKKEEHPGTSTARSYQSRVEIQIDQVKREKLISMNDPLRYKEYTFYQSSFAVDQLGNETSILAVVKNKGRWMPYISTGVTFIGLVIHFVTAFLRSRQRKK